MSRLQTKMVDVSSKADTVRVAVARGVVRMMPETAQMIVAGTIPKGDVLNTARIAGILAAKNTSHIVPLCHPLLISSVDIDLDVDTECGEVVITARVRCTGKTGVEMEALTAVSAAALTVYDMCKVMQKDMVIADLRLLEKSGGKSGDWKVEDV